VHRIEVHVANFITVACKMFSRLKRSKYYKNRFKIRQSYSRGKYSSVFMDHRIDEEEKSVKQQVLCWVSQWLVSWLLTKDVKSSKLGYRSPSSSHVLAAYAHLPSDSGRDFF